MIQARINTLQMTRLIFIICLAGSSMIPASVYAETVRRTADGDDAMRKAQYLLRQLSQEKSALQAEKAQLQGEVDALTLKVSELEKGLEKSRTTLAQSKDKNSQLVERVNRDHQRMQELQEKFRETAGFLQASKADNDHLISAVQERNQWIDTCRARNNKLYEANIELLDQYERKGFIETLGQREPVTRIGSVKVESEVQEYQFRLEDLRMSQFVSNDDKVEAQR